MLLKEPGRQPQNKVSASAHLFKNISLGETTNTFGHNLNLDLDKKVNNKTYVSANSYPESIKINETESTRSSPNK
jgi:hypothetical protein